MNILFDTFEKLLKRKPSRIYKPNLALDGGFIYRIGVVGHTSSLLGFCIEDIFLKAAEDLSVGITFSDQEPWDLCVVCDDALFGHKMVELCTFLERIETPIVAFGIGSEWSLEKVRKSNLRKLKRVLNRMVAVSARNEVVANQIKWLTGRRDISITGDPIFSFKPLPIKQKTSIQKIGISVIDWNNTKSYSNGICQNIANNLDYLIKERQAEAHFFCFERKGTCNDEEATQNIIKKMSNKKRVHIHPYTTDLLLLYSRIQTVDCLISMRSTAGVVALLSGCPTVVMEKRGSRGEEIFGLLGCADFLISSTDICSNNLDTKVRKVENIFPKRMKGLISLAKSWERKQDAFACYVLNLVFKREGMNDVMLLKKFVVWPSRRRKLKKRIFWTWVTIDL